MLSLLTGSFSESSFGPSAHTIYALKFRFLKVKVGGGVNAQKNFNRTEHKSLIFPVLCIQIDSLR